MPGAAAWRAWPDGGRCRPGAPGAAAAWRLVPRQRQCACTMPRTRRACTPEQATRWETKQTQRSNQSMRDTTTAAGCTAGDGSRRSCRAPHGQGRDYGIVASARSQLAGSAGALWAVRGRGARGHGRKQAWSQPPKGKPKRDVGWAATKQKPLALAFSLRLKAKAKTVKTTQTDSESNSSGSDDSASVRAAAGMGGDSE